MSNKVVPDYFKQTKGVSRTSRKSPFDISDSPESSSPSYEKDLELLKSFDLNHEFGPCTGITRMERWNRADKHGLNPPQSVYDLLSQHSNDREYTQNLWKDYQI